MSRIFTVDIGNTRYKVALFDGAELVDFRVFEDVVPLVSFLNTEEIPVVVCSVRGRTVLGEGSRYVYFDASWKYPYGIDISDLRGLGADRLAAVWGAVIRFPGRPLMVVDAGTCVTYEYISGEGRYLGGAISPGLGLRFRSMHDYTSALPELKPLEGLPSKVGLETEGAMRSGVMWGFEAEIRWRMEDFLTRNEDSLVILTGGDLGFLGKPLKTGIFAEPMLLHYGLYYAYRSL